MIFQRDAERGIRYGTLLGLRNMQNPIEEPLGALATAVNFDHTDTNGLERRDGYSLAAALSGATDLYSPVNAEGLYVVEGGTLKSYSDTLVATTIASGLTDTTFSWAEMDGRVFYAGATDAGCILNRTSFLPLRVPTPEGDVEPTAGQDWNTELTLTAATYLHDATGIEGAAAYSYGSPSGTPPEGFSLMTYTSPINGEVMYREDGVTTLAPEQREGVGLPTDITALAFFNSKLYAATYDAATDTSVVFWSPPFYPHIFHLHKDYFPVRGQVLALWATPTALLIGTADRIFVHEGETLKMLAAFGVIPGRPFHADKEGRVAIWTTRGVCTYPDFKAAQMEKVGVPPGTACTTAVSERRGRRQFIVATSGASEAWNVWP